MEVGFVVYFAPSGDVPPDPASLRPAIESWRDEHLTDPLQAVVASLQDHDLVSLRVENVADIPAPPVDLLRHTGLGELEERILGAATHALVCSGLDLNVPPRMGLWSCLAAALAVAEQLEGIIFDPEALRIVRRDRAGHWFTPNGTIAVSQHIIVPFSTGHDAGLGWMTTRGLGKFGLPDIELRDVPPNLDQLNVLMNSVAQLVVEAALRRCDATRGEDVPLEVPAQLEIDRATVARAHGAALPAGSPNETMSRVGLRFDPREREPEPPMIHLLPPDGEADPGVWLNRVAETLLGYSGEHRMVNDESERMLEAHTRAVSELPHAKQRFTAGLRPGEVLYVKHGFDTRTESREYLWLVVTEWTGGSVRGLIVNEPMDVPSLTLGQTVTVDEAGLFDWMIQLPGDRREGGYTLTVTLEEGET